MNKQNCVSVSVTPPHGDNLISGIDKFLSSEFFFENGAEIRDVDVYAKSSSDPELRSKITEYLIENDVQGFDESVSDEEVFEQISSKYDSRQSILAKISNRLRELRTPKVDVEVKREPEVSKV